MENQVQTVNQKNELAVPSEGAWGAETADSRDILIPKILLMQGLSQAVADEKASMGDMVDSLSLEVLGSGRGDGKPVRFVPLFLFKTWVVQEKLGGNKFDFKEIVPFGPDNQDWEWETDTERRDLTLNFYVLLEKDLDNPAALPYVVSFRRTSMQAGKKLSTHFSKCQLAGKPPAASVFELSAKKRENDQGTFFVYDVVQAGDNSKLDTAYKWYLTVREGAKVDNRDLEDAPAKTDSTESEDY